MAEAWLARGSAYYLTGNLEKALADLDQARRLDPGDAETLGVIAAARQKVEAQKAAAAKPVVEAPKPVEPVVVAAAVEPSKPAPAVAAAKAPVAEQPKPVTAKGLEREGRDLLAQSDFDGAVAAFSAAIAKDPKLASAWNGRGYAKMRKADYKGAIEDYTAAIQRNVNYANAYKNRAAAFRMLGNKAMADEDTEMANELHSKLPANVAR